MQITSRIPISALALFLAATAACDRAPSGAREWAPTDHDGAENALQGPKKQPGRPAPGSKPAGGLDPELVEVAWRQSCAKCHGEQGRGDGPEGMMVRAPDLTRAGWQGRVTDQELAETIRKGRDKMPPFNLPPQVIDGLIARIRANRARE